MFKVGDKIVCVDTLGTNRMYSTLTLGKTYTIVRTFNDMNFITIISNRGAESRYWTKRFMLLTEYRKLKLDRICSKLEI